jgi:hypothetical protein
LLCTIRDIVDIVEKRIGSMAYAYSNFCYDHSLVGGIPNGQGDSHFMALEPKVRVAPNSLELNSRVESTAQLAKRPRAALRLQTLLQLPRIADERGFAPATLVDAILLELATELPASPEWSVADSASSSPRALDFQDVDLDEGRQVMERFHYLRSARLDGRIYGLRSKAGRLVALCVSSPLDVDRLAELLRREQRVTQTARVLSRVFVFEGAPPNTISYLLSRAARSERRLGVTDWVTYVNPNMGFSGVSYLASGWHYLGDEPGTTYKYLDNRYITERELTTRFGPHDDESYYRLLGDRFSKSVMPLSPLLVFSRYLSNSTSAPTLRAYPAESEMIR